MCHDLPSLPPGGEQASSPNGFNGAAWRAAAHERSEEGSQQRNCCPVRSNAGLGATFGHSFARTKIEATETRYFSASCVCEKRTSRNCKYESGVAQRPKELPFITFFDSAGVLSRPFTQKRAQIGDMLW
jgi:hypothetical protein